MIDDPRAITYIGSTDFRNSNVEFGIRAKDRLRHTYIIGSTGVGKSFLIENMFIQDLQNGNGVALLDPHGSTAEKMLKYIPADRIKDVIYFAPHDLEHPIGFNPLEDPGPDFRSQVSDGLLTAFKRIWVDAFSARMEYVLSNTLLALLEYPDATLLSVNRMLADKKFREKVVANVRDPSVKSVWVDEFMKWEDKFAREAFSAIQNKVGQFTANPMIRNILGQPKSTLDFRDMMDTRKIFIANLSKGRVGEQNAPLIGAMLITKIYLASMSRADKNEYEMNFLPPFYLYVDEFQNFANDSFENILSESRKYKLGLIVAHQYITQMPETIQNAVFGNVGTKIIFRTQKPEDAEIFEKVFTPVFTQSDIMNLGLAQIYLTLLIDGVGSAPFSAKTIRQMPPPAITFENEAIAASRTRYTRPRAEVEAEIAQWFLSGTQAPNGYPAQPGQQGGQQSGYSQNSNGNSGNYNGGQQPRSNPDSNYAGNAPQTEEGQAAARKKDEEHKAYLEQKKKEIEDRGGVWLSPEEYKGAKENGTLDQLMSEKRIELTNRKMLEAKAAREARQAEEAIKAEEKAQEKPAHVPPKPATQANGQSQNQHQPQNQNRPERPNDRGDRNNQRPNNSAPRRHNDSPERPAPRPQPESPARDYSQSAPAVAVRKNEANTDTKDSLKSMLEALKQPAVRYEVTPNIPAEIAPASVVSNVILTNPSQSSTVTGEYITTVGIDNITPQAVNTVNIEVNVHQPELTSENPSAQYTHANIQPPPVQPASIESPVSLQPPTHIPGWNEISPADLARALGTKL